MLPEKPASPPECIVDVGRADARHGHVRGQRRIATDGISDGREVQRPLVFGVSKPSGAKVIPGVERVGRPIGGVHAGQCIEDGPFLGADEARWAVDTNGEREGVAPRALALERGVLRQTRDRYAFLVFRSRR